MIRYAIGLLVLLSAMTAAAGEDTPAQTGIFTTHFEDRSPYSNLDEMVKVTRWPREQARDYDLADHTFQLIVPKDYDGSEAYGLLVFIHPNNTIDTKRFYGQLIKDVLAKHKLIWVSYDKAGNDVLPNVRMGLALDAAHNMAKQYRIDKKRVYVSGLSGGGRMTCMTGIYYPQVFTGAIPIVGTLYFRDVNLPEDPAQLDLLKGHKTPADGVWRRSLIPPKAKRLEQMKKEQRWVLLAGETDYNMPQMRAHFEQGFERDGFALAHYLEVKGMGHNYPDAKWYDRALKLLEEDGEKAGDLEPADERTQRLAHRRLEVALRTLDRDQGRGVRALERLIDDLPNTEAAVQAREKLRTLDTQ